MRTLKHLMALSTALSALAYENKAGWKTDDSGNIVVDGNGNPIMLDDKGGENPIAPGYIQRINTESATHRRAAKEATDKLAKFGDLDPEAAREAIDKTKDLDLSKMVEKGEVDKIKQSITAQFETQLRERDEKLTKTAAERDNLLRKNAFTSSKFLSDRLAVPRDAAEALYGDRFKIEDGQLVPVRPNGDVIYNSRGEVASVDEAFEMFITERDDKDTWLRAPNHSGSGSGGGGGGRPGGNVMKRADYDKMAPMEKAQVGQKIAKGELKVVD